MKNGAGVKRLGWAAGLALVLAIGGQVPASAQTGAPAPSSASSEQVASLSTADGIDTSLPAVLDAADVERYQRIFEFQADTEWAKADREIARLKDKLLLGHVLHQRFTHPTAYNASYAELRDWMVKYRDHPGAEEIYKQALKKKPRKDKAPPGPLGTDLGEFNGEQPGEVATARRRPVPKERDPAHRQAIQQAEAQFNAMLKRDRFRDAEAFLAKPDIRAKLSASEYDDWRRRLAWLYVLEGENDKALQHAAPAAQRSRARVPEADWVAGLAAWRLGKYDNAAHHFENLAFSKTAAGWDRAAAAWWGARVMLRLRQPSEAIRLLEIGASQERTFYGQLSLAQLGNDQPLRWSPPPLSADEVRKLSDMPALRRAMALSEAGEAVRADREITRLFSQAPDQLAGALLGFASRLQAPASSMRIGIAWYTVKGEGFDHALYPLPPWEPESGFSVDRALVFAFMRQESAFNARAMSPAGATGLMQLMPKTAGAVAGDRSLHHKSGRHRLFAPEYNIELGQRYLQHLLEMPMIRGNLFYLAAAYNGGPGNLQKWLRANPDAAADPLLFIETIPLAETRNFVQRVLTNYWIYRSRIGQPDPSLPDAMAGGWPLYKAFDKAQQTANR